MILSNYVSNNKLIYYERMNFFSSDVYNYKNRQSMNDV